MSISSNIRSMLINLVEKLGLTRQDETKQVDGGDHLDKAKSISFTDMMTSSLANLQCQSFTLPIGGDNLRAMWLDAIADDFVNLKLATTVQTTCCC